MKILKRSVSGGFTLVELLIVIALIAILSVAVLATINPIEQTNKARDAKFKNDAAEVLGALERYYASKSEYPWNDLTFIAPGPLTIDAGNVLVMDGTDPRFGIVAADGAATGGLLITTSELKSSFMSKESFSATVKNQDRMYVYHNGSDSNYVCFCPKATANRTGTIAASLKCISDEDITLGVGYRLDNVGDAGCVAPTVAQISSATFCDAHNSDGVDIIANMLCVPEGNVN
jgi:prepilin-type N-terminal cleavage/methylation domain-containing protein